MLLAQPAPRCQYSRKSGPRWWFLFLLLSFFPAITALPQDDDESKVQMAQALRHVGQWVWDKQTFDKQTIRLWNSFTIPRGARVSSAIIYITVDNSYRLMLDGREVGRGSDWKTISQYDVKSLLEPGDHVLAIEAFNDRLAGGLIFGMQIEMPGRPPIVIKSDDHWKVVPLDEGGWETAKHPSPAWGSVIVEGKAKDPPWTPWPYAVVSVPPLHPLIYHFWQTVWFQITLLSLLGVAVLFSLWLMTQLAAQAKGQRFLQMERARIARDIHDDLGAQLTQLVLQGEVAQREHPADSPARTQFNQLCERAREISRAMGEIVWAVNSRRDTVRDFVTYVCKYAGTFLADTSIRCRLEVEPEIPAIPFDLPTRRNLFLAVKEALNNAARHSGADELFLRIWHGGDKLIVVVEDNGRGFDSARVYGGGNGMDNMVQRMSETGGVCTIVSQPGAGCVVTFIVKLERASQRAWFEKFRNENPEEMEIPKPAPAPVPDPVNAQNQ
jgi:signal transduction histidine kinase